jgi:hypothetical protein
MSMTEVIITFLLASLFAGYFYFMHRARVRRNRPNPDEWTGTGIDVSSLKPRLEDVRRNYVAVCRPARAVSFRRNLLRIAQRAVAHLAFFEDRKSKEQTP